MRLDLSDRHLWAKTVRELALSTLVPAPRSLAIFGSFAGGTLHDASDIDVLILGNTLPKLPYERAKWFNPLRKAYQQWHLAAGRDPFPVLAPLILTEESWLDAIALRLSVSQQCWTLWDDGFLSQSLNEATDWIRQGKWTRQDVPSGGWFWIEQKDPGSAA